jgi:dCMP deaminase
MSDATEGDALVGASLPRPTKWEMWLQVAEVVAKRSTCLRNQVGAVITDWSLLQVLGLGYNGNARGLPNTCDHPEAPGMCGCLHAELNALLKAPGIGGGGRKILFSTHGPCLTCTKAILNSQIQLVIYRAAYRETIGVRTLLEQGIRVVHSRAFNTFDEITWGGTPSGYGLLSKPLL